MSRQVGARSAHGTDSRYRYGCRCEECRRDHTARAIEGRKRRVGRGLAPGDERHGTSNGYRNWGCRCQPCVGAGKVQNRQNYAARHGETLRIRRWTEFDDFMIAVSMESKAEDVARLNDRTVTAVRQRRAFLRKSGRLAELLAAEEAQS